MRVWTRARPAGEAGWSPFGKEEDGPGTIAMSLQWTWQDSCASGALTTQLVPITWYWSPGSECSLALGTSRDTLGAKYVHGGASQATSAKPLVFL